MAALSRWPERHPTEIEHRLHSPQFRARSCPAALPRADHQNADAEERPAAGLPAEYRIAGPAACGSFCEVWKVRGPGGRTCAFKRLRPEIESNRAARDMLLNEATATAAVNSPYIVRFVKAELQAERPFVLLEWLEGRTLAEKLRGGERLPVGEAIWLARQCVEGLVALAEAGYAHGDLKPSNIFLTGGGRVKLIDLGFARPVNGGLVGGRPQLLMGTADYMAPEELARGAFAPIQKDLYSLGVTIFRMLAGRLPFLAENAAEMLRLQRQAKPRRLRELCPDVPAELDELVAQLLAKQPIRRPQSLAGVLRELISLELQHLPRAA